MYSFICDYSEGAHPRLIEALSRTNMEQCEGYGEDAHCLRAAELLKKKMNRNDVEIHFMPGGTPTNVIALTACLRSFEAIIAPKTGHIEIHETGAVEARGHKILTVETDDGKLRPADVQKVLDGFEDEHTVRRKVVFVTNPTEIGTIYTKAELKALKEICRANDMYLYLDGARLGCALTAQGNDLTFADLPDLCDIFYIGGTKNGMLLGEALVIVNDALKPDFRFHIKQGCALTAKGRVVGVQFEAMFEDDLYLEIAKHANDMAAKLASGIEALGYSFLAYSPTNQIFPILPYSVIEQLEKEYAFYVWEKVDDAKAAIRLVTSWATPEDQVDRFLDDLKRLHDSLTA